VSCEGMQILRVDVKAAISGEDIYESGSASWSWTQINPSNQSCKI
jgi:hypothetical protein